MEEFDGKKPAKGILKSSSSFDKQEKAFKRNKNTKWDEMNIMATYHPADKDYGHMKVEEPKTPYNWDVPSDEVDAGPSTTIDADILHEKLTQAANIRRRSTPSASEDEDEEDESNLSDSERSRRREFKNRRKMHYNEFKVIQLARKLIEEEDEEENKSLGISPMEVVPSQDE